VPYTHCFRCAIGLVVLQGYFFLLFRKLKPRMRFLRRTLGVFPLNAIARQLRMRVVSVCSTYIDRPSNVVELLITVNDCERHVTKWLAGTRLCEYCYLVLHSRVWLTSQSRSVYVVLLTNWDRLNVLFGPATCSSDHHQTEYLFIGLCWERTRAEFHFVCAILNVSQLVNLCL